MSNLHNIVFQGDSGGPLIAERKNDKRYELIGNIYTVFFYYNSSHLLDIFYKKNPKNIIFLFCKLLSNTYRR